MQAAHMTFEEEVIKLRAENKLLRKKTAYLEKTNKQLSEKVILLEKENKELKQENTLLKQEQKILLEKQAILEKQVESLQLIVEELRGVVFRKKTKKEDDDNSSGNTGSNQVKRKSADRTKDSYRRSKPKDLEVTYIVTHPLTHCQDCGTLLIQLKQIIRYVEDLANLTELSKMLKTIEKHIIENLKISLQLTMICLLINYLPSEELR
jgi:hypothetical protein